MRKLRRLFFYEAHKGERGYLRTQRRYELARTMLYFALALAVLAIGWISTGTRNNLLTILAVLGLLPASKSLVETVMFYRYPGCPEEDAERIAEVIDGSLPQAFDRVFTSYSRNFVIDHLVVRGGTICGYLARGDLDENAFREHIGAILAAEKYTGVPVKIFQALPGYLDRLKALAAQGSDERDEGIRKTLLSVSL